MPITDTRHTAKISCCSACRWSHCGVGHTHPVYWNGKRQERKQTWLCRLLLLMVSDRDGESCFIHRLRSPNLCPEANVNCVGKPQMFIQCSCLIAPLCCYESVL